MPGFAHSRELEPGAVASIPAGQEPIGGAVRICQPKHETSHHKQHRKGKLHIAERGTGVIKAPRLLPAGRSQ